MCATQLAGGSLLKMLKCFMLNMNHPVMFLDRDSETMLVPVFFSYFLELLLKKTVTEDV